jgi:hypothetical protein
LRPTKTVRGVARERVSKSFFEAALTDFAYHRFIANNFCSGDPVQPISEKEVFVSFGLEEDWGRELRFGFDEVTVVSGNFVVELRPDFRAVFDIDLI